MILEKYFECIGRLLFPNESVLCTPNPPTEDMCRDLDSALSIEGVQCQCCVVSEDAACLFCSKAIGWHNCPRARRTFTPGTSYLRWKPGTYGNLVSKIFGHT